MHTHAHTRAHTHFNYLCYPFLDAFLVYFTVVRIEEILRVFNHSLAHPATTLLR